MCHMSGSSFSHPSPKTSSLRPLWPLQSITLVMFFSTSSSALGQITLRPFCLGACSDLGCVLALGPRAVTRLSV